MRRACIVLSLLVAGCASSHALNAAKQGDYASLRTELAARHKAGSLTNGEAADIARAVVARDLANAKEKEALERLRDTRMCAQDLDDALAERMKTRDQAGAEAAMARLEAGKLSASRARDLLNDPDDAWRAVGVRALTEEEDRRARQKAMLDPSPRVRGAAMRAAAVAKDPADLDTLLESARVDPEPLVRTHALRAASLIDGSKAHEIAMRLRDLWTTADDPLREDIAVAWSMPAIYVAGGREALRVLVAAEHGPGALAGAGAILRNREKDAELARTATALLVRTMASGSVRDRVHAIAVAPTGNAEMLEALRKASKDDDSAVRVSAFARLLGSAPDRDEAIRSLEQFAGQKDNFFAPQARLALAGAKDLRIQAWIEWDLASPDPHRRVIAATALANLGRAARGAPLLADSDPGVRARAACAILVAAR